VFKFSNVGRPAISSTPDVNLNGLQIRTDGSPKNLKNTSCIDGSVECVFKNIEQRLITEIYKHDYVIGCVAWLTHFDILAALATRKGVCIVVQKEDFLRPDSGGGPSKEDLRAWYKKVRGICRYDLARHGAGLVSGLSVCGDPYSAAIRCCGVFEKMKKAVPRCHHKFVVFCDGEIEHHEAVAGTDEVCTTGLWKGMLVNPGTPAYNDIHLKPVSVWTGSFNFTQNAVLSFENAVIISNSGIVRAYTAEFEQVFALSEPLDWKHVYVEPEYRIGT